MVNKVILLGHLGSDVEIKNLEGGTALANFSLATNESWTDKSGQKQERTEWHRIVVFGKLASICHQFLHKGGKAYVEGKIRTRSYEQDGVKKYSTEIQAETVQFLSERRQ